MKKKKVALIAISRSIGKKRLNDSIKNCKLLGYYPIYHSNVLNKFLFYAGKAKERADQIQWAFENSNIDVIFTIKGGHGVVHTLEHLDYEKIKSNYKPLVGFSDMTILLNYLYQKIGVITFHGPHMSQDISKCKMTYECLINTLEKIPSIFKIKPEDIIFEGKAKGKIVGGNIALIIRSMGTKYEINTNNKIIFLEAVDKFHAWIYDSLYQLYISKKLEKCKGIILGEFKQCKDAEKYIFEFFKEYNIKIPIIKNQKFGHGFPNCTIPIGGDCIIDTKKGYWKVSWK
jgi:muramoyltetrapeptide carboxypeptidase